MKIFSAILSFHLFLLSVEPMAGLTGAKIFSESCMSGCEATAENTCDTGGSCGKETNNCNASGSLCIFSINCCCCLCFYFDDARVEVKSYVCSDVDYFYSTENFIHLFSSDIFQPPETV